MGVPLDLAVNVAASVVTGGAVWTWQKQARSRRQVRRASFFGLKRNDECLIVMNQRPCSMAGTMSHGDAQTVADAAALAASVGARPVMLEESQVQSVGRTVEFCVGGPESNARTKAHLESFAPGFIVRPYDSSSPDSVAFDLDGELFRYKRDVVAYVLVARLRARPDQAPMFVFCGHTALANRAGLAYLLREIDTLRRKLGDQENFALLLRVDNIGKYGTDSVVLDRDVTDRLLAKR